MMIRPGTSRSFGKPSSATSSYALEREIPRSDAKSVTVIYIGSSSRVLIVDDFISSPSFPEFYVRKKAGTCCGAQRKNISLTYGFPMYALSQHMPTLDSRLCDDVVERMARVFTAIDKNIFGCM